MEAKEHEAFLVPTKRTAAVRRSLMLATARMSSATPYPNILTGMQHRPIHYI